MSPYLKIGIISLNVFSCGVITLVIWFVCELVSHLT